MSGGELVLYHEQKQRAQALIGVVLVACGMVVFLGEYQLHNDLTNREVLVPLGVAGFGLYLLAAARRPAAAELDEGGGIDRAINGVGGVALLVSGAYYAATRFPKFGHNIYAAGYVGLWLAVMVIAAYLVAKARNPAFGTTPTPPPDPDPPPPDNAPPRKPWHPR